MVFKFLAFLAWRKINIKFLLASLKHLLILKVVPKIEDRKRQKQKIAALL
jgi:hypothetical protein